MNEIEIKAGAYYLKRGSRDGWLRLVLELPSARTLGRLVYADFTGVEMCYSATFLRWADRPLRPLTRAQADSDEVAKIDTVLRNSGTFDHEPNQDEGKGL